MRVTIFTVGTRGDVQPYVALALGLRRSGHDVRLATFGDYRALVEDRGLDFCPVEGDITARLRSEDGIAWLESGRNPITYIRRTERVIGPLMPGVIASSVAACRGADLVVGPLVSARVAERLGIPSVVTSMWPLARTRSFPSPLTWGPAPLRRLGPVNSLSYALLEWMLESGRSRWGTGLLSRLETRRAPHLYPFSPEILPRPADWRPWHHVTGYWFLDAGAGWQPPTDVVEFLRAGPPPVYVGFGSSTMRAPEAVLAVVLDALRRAGRRGILQGWWPEAAAGPLGDDMLVIGSTPHEWLFPQVSAVVHHGGAGTTGSGLRAGVPAVLLPFYADQPFWAWRIEALGIGPQPVPFPRLTGERLAAAILAAVTDRGIGARAAAVGRRVQAEDGVAMAVAAIEAAAAV